MTTVVRAPEVCQRCNSTGYMDIGGEFAEGWSAARVGPGGLGQARAGLAALAAALVAEGGAS